MARNNNLRRSRRAANASKKTSDYNVDDIVEIVRGNATVRGRLAQLLSDPSSPNPRWLIKFDGLPLKDEEVYEHSFAKNQNVESDNSSSDREGNHYRRSTRNSRHSSNSDNERNSDGESDVESSRTRANRAKAREARSRRRQAKIESTVKRRLPGPPPNHPSRKAKRARHHHVFDHHSNGGSKNHHPTGSDEDDGEVVKVKLLTGTLYMYRGLNRRAEFVRRV